MSENTFSLTEKITNAINATDYIGKTVTLKDGKTGWSGGLCPFHEESNPSFFVSSTSYHCKGCGVSGNVIGFKSAIENIEYGQAKRLLALELGIYQEKKLDAQQEVLERVSKRYHKNLKANRDIIEYTKERGLKQTTLELFGIGYCIGDEFSKASESAQEIACQAGVLSPVSSGGVPYNAMKRRLTFTIRDRHGIAVGFGGRKMDTEARGGKYINTRDTAYFKKSNILFGLYEARNAIHKEKFAIVVEGYMDAIILHQEGIQNTVAVMGASCSDEAFESLWRRTKHAIFCLDGDAAGRAGTYRSVMAAASLMKDDSKIGVIDMPEGMDPDEYVLKFGAQAFKKLSVGAMSLSQYLCERTLDAEEEAQGIFTLRVAEDRARYLSLIQEVASNFHKAPALQLEIQREAQATVNAFVIDAALRQRHIDASPDEIMRALEMMASTMKSGLGRGILAPEAKLRAVTAEALGARRPEPRCSEVLAELSDIKPLLVRRKSIFK